MRREVWAAIVLVLVSLVGCGGRGQSIPMSVPMEVVPAPTPMKPSLRVTVVTFEDARKVNNKSMIGRWQHYVESDVDRFIPASGSASDQVTTFVADYLKRAGFEVSRAQTPEQVSSGSTDVVLTGQIEAYWNEAVKRLAKTDLTAKNRLVLTILNVADGSTVKTMVEGEGTTKVAVFNPVDLERLNGEALGQSLAKFLSDLKVVDRSIKSKHS